MSADPVSGLRALFGRLDRLQRKHPGAGVPYAVIKKFGDDNANLLAVGLAWYGFTGIFPLLLALVTILGFVGQESLGSDLVSTLHQFPVIGDSFNPANAATLHGSTLGLVVGLLGLIYGGQGVTQTAQQAMASVWDIPQFERTGFLPRLGRSLTALIVIGVTFLLNAVITGYATRPGESYVVRVPVLAGLLIVNTGLYWLSFRTLTPKAVPARALIRGAAAGAFAFTVLITVGTGLVTHQLRHTSATYGAFGSVIGIVTFLLLLAKISLYAAELNPVLFNRLYPRALPMVDDLTDADRRVMRQLVREQVRQPEQRVGVGFPPDAADEAARDAYDDSGPDRGATASADKRDAAADKR